MPSHKESIISTNVIPEPPLLAACKQIRQRDYLNVLLQEQASLAHS